MVGAVEASRAPKAERGSGTLSIKLQVARRRPQWNERQQLYAANCYADGRDAAGGKVLMHTVKSVFNCC